MTAYTGRCGITSVTLNVSTREKLVVNNTLWLLYTQKITPIPNEKWAEWATELVRKIQRREKSPVPVAIRTANLPAKSLGTTPTTRKKNSKFFINVVSKRVSGKTSEF